MRRSPQAAGAVAHLLGAVFDAQRADADPADRLQHVARQGLDGKSRPDLAAVADHPDEVAVEDLFALWHSGPRASATGD